MGTNGTPPTPKQTTRNAPTSVPPPKKKDQQKTSNNQGKPSQTPNIIDYIIPTIIIENLLDQ